jgi:uncharacterized repeat protein (TIGR03803 family)
MKYKNQRLVVGLFAALMLLAANPAWGASEKVLYSFTGGTDGGGPLAGVVFDGSGNLYGTTHFGGITTCGGIVGGGCGVVFQLAPSMTTPAWTEYVLYSFADGTDGGFPNGSLLVDSSGDVFGTASVGGNTSCTDGCGVVFRIFPSPSGGGWVERVIHHFDGTDGSFPNAALIFDGSGNLYSTTVDGGASGDGTVFELTPSAGNWTETLLYSFTGGSDGNNPYAGLVMDASGNLYGTTYPVGDGNHGVVFELKQVSGVWTLEVLHTFTGGNDGGNPYAGLILDGAGNLYGTTAEGGADEYGVVFKLSPPSGTGTSWTETVLHTFTGGNDGGSPYGGLVFDASGNLYGATVFGGADGYGVAYKLTPVLGTTGGWTETLLHTFTGGNDGGYPECTLVFDSSGNLFGTTTNGGASGNGVVFEIVP